MLTCLRCNHQWIQRGLTPKRCPKCKSYLWNKAPGKAEYPVFKGDVNPIVNLPPRLYNQLKNHLFIAMRDKYPKIEFELKGNEIIEIL